MLGADGLCTNDLYEALVMKDEKTHQLAREVVRRTGWDKHKSQFESDLRSEHLVPEQRDRVVASLEAFTGQDFGNDYAAWDAWLRSQ